MAVCIAIAVGACVLLVTAQSKDPAVTRDHVVTPDSVVAGKATTSASKEDPSASERESSAGGADVKFNAATVYDALAPLGQQLPRLRAEAGRGNTYAICILATALDSCVEQMMGSNESPWKDLSSGDAIEKGNDRQIQEFSAELEKHKRLDFMCTSVNQNDMLERDAWMLKSAVSGNPRSMARFALNPDFAGVMRMDDIDRMIEYRKSAENMLNRAASAGVPDAILGVYRAYSYGAIVTSVGELKVDKDPAKAVAAAKAILPFLDDAERKETESGVSMLVANMDKAQLARMVSDERAYKKAYQSRAAAEIAGREAKADSPEAVCSSYAQ